MFVEKCLNCQQVKAEYLKPRDLTQSIEIPTWKCESINMDLVFGLPLIRRLHDSIWVIVDKMNKYADIIPVKYTYRAKHYPKLYIDEIVRCHGIPLSIISDRGA